MARALVFRCFLAASLVVVTHAGRAQVQQPQPTAPAGFVLGTVVDADSGRPIPDVVVRLANDQQALANVGLAPASAISPHAAITDSQGRFLLRAVPKGSYSVSTAAAGYAPGGFGQRRPNGPQRQLQVEEGEAVADVVIRVWKFASIEGTVVDEGGEPAVGVAVRALRRGYTGGRLRLSPAGASAQTDDRGIFRISNLMPGDYVVAAPSTVSSAPTSVVDAMNEGDRMTMLATLLEVGASGALNGGGLRVGDLTVSTSTMRGSLAGPEPSANRPIEMYPTVYHPNAATVTQARTLTLGSGEERRSIDLQLRLVAGYRISGTVAGPEGPVPMTSLRLVPAAIVDQDFEGGFETATTIATPDGRFTFPAVPIGDYVIKVLRVPRAAPSPNAIQMTVTQVGGTTITSGSFNTPEPLPNAPTLWVERAISVTDRDVLDLSLPLNHGARVSGRLVFEGAAAPPPPERLSLVVTLSRADGASTAGMPVSRTTPDGQFRTNQYPPGKYLMGAGSPGSPWTLRSITVGSVNALDEPFDLGADDIANVVITYIDRTSSLEGSVRVEGRTGDPDAIVVAFPANWKRWIETGMPARNLRQSSVQANGTYRLTSIPPGEFLVIAIPADTARDTGDPTFIAALADRATRVTIPAGGSATLALTLVRPK